MSLKIRTLDSGNTDGIKILDLREAELQDPETCAELRSLWIKHGLIVFNGEITNSLHIALSRVFGDLERHPVKEIWVE
ncbi:MAG: hypothetical protein ABW049_05185, partial [Spongiibacteraceae bacterium]